MFDINNFSNIFYVTDKNFEGFKRKLMEIETPSKIVHWGVKPTGAFYAIGMTDRPVTEAKKERTIIKKD